MGNILHEVQDYVVGKLSADNQLSGNCTFLAENRKDIDYEIKNALGRQGIVGVVMTPRATYAGKYEDLFLAWTLEELEIDIVENPIVNRGKKTSYMTGQDIGLRVFDVLCPLSGDFEGQFCPQTIEEGEDSGLIVNRCVLKALVYGEHGDTPQPEPGLNMQFVKLLDGPPSKPPHDGWMWPADGGFVLWQNGEAHELGGVSFDQMSSYVDSKVSSIAGSYLPLSGGTVTGPTLFDSTLSVGNYTFADNATFGLLIRDFSRPGDLDERWYFRKPNLDRLVPRTIVTLGMLDESLSNYLQLSAVDSAISSKADLSALDSYLPLSGGQVNGALSVGNGVELFNEADGGVVRISNGNANETFYQHNKIGTPNGNLYYPVSIPEQDEVVATREWTSRNYTKISAMTEDEYEQITPDPTTLYVITED